MKVAGLQGLTSAHRTMPVRLLRFLVLILLLSSYHAVAQQKNAGSTVQGKHIFAVNCAACHGLDGQGSERGPDIANRRVVQQRTDQALSRIVRDGVSGTGMPSFR